MTVIVTAALFGLSESHAAQSVKINGYLYTCQNSCVVSTRHGGGFSIWDSRKGWVTKTALSGEAIVEQGPKPSATSDRG